MFSFRFAVWTEMHIFFFKKITLEDFSDQWEVCVTLSN